MNGRANQATGCRARSTGERPACGQFRADDRGVMGYDANDVLVVVFGAFGFPGRQACPV